MRSTLLKNNKGSALVLAMVVSTVTMLGLVTANQLTNNQYSKMRMQLAANERVRLKDTLKTLLNDQRMCKDLFPNGYATTNNTIVNFPTPVTPVAPVPKTTSSPGSPGTSAINNSLYEIKDDFKFYRPDRIRLTNMTNLQPDQNAVRYKQFNVTISVVNVSDNLLTGAFGTQVNDAESRDLKMIFSDNGRCYMEGFGDMDLTSKTGIATTCKAMLGTYNNGRCTLKKYNEEFPDVLNITKVDNTTSTFSDALCRQELAVLRKINGHWVGNSTTPEAMALGWTSLCARPQWAGCRASGSVDRMTALGNDPESVNFKMAGEKWEGNQTGHIRRLKEIVVAGVKPSLSRRLNRVTGAILNNPTTPYMMDVDGGMGSYLNGLHEIGKAVGALLGTSSTLGAIGSLLLLGATLGPIGVIAAIFIPRCNQGMANFQYQCNDGVGEVTSVNYYNQKLKIGAFYMKCRWNYRGTYKVWTDKEIYDKRMHALSLSSGASNGGDDSPDPDSIASIIAKLNDPSLTLEGMRDLFNAQDPDAECADMTAENCPLSPECNVPKEIPAGLCSDVGIDLNGKQVCLNNSGCTPTEIAALVPPAVCTIKNPDRPSTCIEVSEPEPDGIPAEVEDAVRARELELWVAYLAQVKAKLPLIEQSADAQQDQYLSVDPCIKNPSLADCGGPTDVCVVRNTQNQANRDREAAEAADADPLTNYVYVEIPPIAACDGVKPASVDECALNGIADGVSGCQSDRWYTNYQVLFYNQKYDQLVTISEELVGLINFAKSIKYNSNTRNLLTDPLYTGFEMIQFVIEKISALDAALVTKVQNICNEGVCGEITNPVSPKTILDQNPAPTIPPPADDVPAGP